MTVRKLFWSVLRFGLTVGLLIAIFRRIPLGNVYRSLQSLAPAPFFLSVLGVFLMRYFASHRTKILTDVQGLKLSTGEIFEISCVSTFYGLALPGSLSGGAVRWYRFARRQNQPAGALTSIALDRLIDITSLIALGCAFWVVDVHGGTSSPVGVGLAMGLVVLVAILALAVHESGTRAVLNPVRRLNWAFLPKPVLEAFRNVVAAIRQYHGRPPRFFLSVIGWSFASQIVSTLAFFAAAASLQLHSPLASLGWIRAYITLLAILPVSFAGLGVREGALVLLLAPYGVSGADAVALSFLQLVCMLAVAAVGAIYELRRSIWNRVG